MKKVLIIPAPAVSHLYASFKIANILSKYGYEVHYFTHNSVAHMVMENKFQHYSSFNGPITEDYNEKAMKTENIQFSYYDRFRDGVMRVLIDNRKEELVSVVNKVNPDIIIADTFAGGDFALLYRILKEQGIRFFQFEAMPSILDVKGYPYFDSKALPEQRLKIAMEHIKRKCKKKWRRLWRRIIYVGYDTYTTLLREMKQQGMAKKYVINQTNFFDLTYKAVPSMLTLPLEMEFFKEPPDRYQHYLGFFVNEKAKQEAVVESRLQTLLDIGKPIIYISFGTVFGGIRADDIVGFMQKLNTALAEFKDTIAIFSMGNAHASMDEMNRLSNIHAFGFVPQLYLLQFCSVFVTHGGLNSMKEGIQEAVPMLVIPLEVDQTGNARKIAHKQLGLLGDVETETVEQLKTKIGALLHQTKYKENLQKFRDTIAANYDVEAKVMQIIENEGVVE
jgi:zeaxanthin glucosyltransferase